MLKAGYLFPFQTRWVKRHIVPKGLSSGWLEDCLSDSKADKRLLIKTLYANPSQRPSGGNPRRDPSSAGRVLLMERRRSPRYPLRLRMSITAVDGSAGSVDAYTANLSRTGVLFRTSKPLNVGQQLEYVIDLYPGCGVQLRCKGKVVRSASESGELTTDHLVAATLDEYECIRNSSPSVPAWTFEEQYV